MKTKVSQLNSKTLRASLPSKAEVKALKRNDIYIIVDNVLDTYNIGSIFRLADAMAVQKIYLCAGSDTPPNHRITKASVNTWQWVRWQYQETAVSAIDQLKKTIPDLNVIAIEQTKTSISYIEADYCLPLALIVGHETTGVSKDALKLANQVVKLPLYGINNSLNVVIALGVIGYRVLESQT